MKNKVLLFFFAAVCFATTFANNKPPGQKISYLSSVTSTSMRPYVEQTVMSCDNTTMMMTRKSALISCYNHQFCMPASDYKFGVMLQINKMMYRNHGVLGYTSLKGDFIVDKVKGSSSFPTCTPNRVEFSINRSASV